MKFPIDKPIPYKKGKTKRRWCGKCGAPLPDGGGPCPVCEDRPYGKPNWRKR